MLLLISSSFLQHNPLTGLQRDDVTLGAGDGTRTRDSLLGRQELRKTQVASFEHP